MGFRTPLIQTDRMDTSYGHAYVLRAERREAERLRRHQETCVRARRVARMLRARYGEELRVYLFGSALDADRFRLGSDLDLAVAGLTPSEYWEAWRESEQIAGSSLDFVHLDHVSAPLRRRIVEEGQQLP